MEDKDIIALYLARNMEGITSTANKYGGKLQLLAERILDSKEDAAECVNDTYLRAWNSIPPASPTYLQAYLAKICRNEALNKLDYRNAQKRKTAFVELTKEIEACIPDNRREEQVKEQELRVVLNRFLKELPEEKRNVFLRRYWFGDSCKEVAEHFGYSESKIKVMLHRMRKELKKYLEREGIWV
ncbi:MAG: RNA polymerase sigma factor [Lachnospiraceae bacterium]|nr:RNA polymerase sigma factor [Lachnospiraceae bacterium]